MAPKPAPPISGRCACGKIEYACIAEASFSLICQCRQCQRITGTGHSAQFAVQRESTAIQGDVQTYRLTSEAGNEVTSAFCGHCGNPIYKATSLFPDLILFHAATMDEPAMFKPGMVVHSDSCQPWDCVDPSLPRQQ